MRQMTDKQTERPHYAEMRRNGRITCTERC